MNSIGQLLFTGINSTVLSDEEKEFIERENIGGVLLAQRNFENPAQLAELINSIQVLRDEYPLFIAVNHEGGKGSILSQGFTSFPSMGELAKLDSPKLCYQTHKIMAEELLACGINLCLSPSCDIINKNSYHSVKTNSYGTNEEDVSKFVTSAIRGLQTNGIIACAKHFPGYGLSHKSLYEEMPIIKIDEQTWLIEDMQPFAKASKARVEMILISHMIMDCLDENRPASLSPLVIEKIRTELKFKKIIISDQIDCTSISKKYAIEEAALQSLLGGVDMVLVKDFENSVKICEYLKEAKKKMVIKNNQINKKNERVIDVKKRYLSNYNPIYIPSIAEKLKRAASLSFIKEIEEKISPLR